VARVSANDARWHEIRQYGEAWSCVCSLYSYFIKEVPAKTKKDREKTETIIKIATGIQ